MDKDDGWRVHPVYTKYSGHADGLVRNNETGKELKGYNSRGEGYRRLLLSYNNGLKHCYLHVFVFECFNGLVDSTAYDIDHIDEDNTNNQLKNLQKMSHKDHTRKGNISNPDKYKKRSQKIMKGVVRVEFDSLGNESTRLTFQSIDEAAKTIKSSVINIRDVCNHKRETFKGYKWEWISQPDLAGEYWVCLLDPIFKGIEVSNLGRINNRRNVKSFGCLKKCGYVDVHLSDKVHRVHRLICTAFHGPQPTPKHSVNHIDRNKSNNAANNLEWATHQEQCDHANSKPVQALHKDTKEIIGTWVSASEAARQLGFKSTCISSVCRGRTMSHHNYIWRFV
jgi:HNH endonuclease